MTLIRLHPPVPYTPKMYLSLPRENRVTFWYAGGHEAMERFSEAVDALANGAAKYELLQGVAKNGEQAAHYRGQQGAAAARLLAKLEAEIADADAVLNSPGFASVQALDRDQQHDAYANALGIVLVSVSQGEVSSAFPQAHDRRLEYVRGIPPGALVDLVRAVRGQQYDESEAGN